jgi:hypothetical protein
MAVGEIAVRQAAERQCPRHLADLGRRHVVLISRSDEPAAADVPPRQHRDRPSQGSM